MIYAVYKKLIYKIIRYSRLEDINASELIEEETERKGGIITLIKSNINAYMSSSSNNGAEQHTIAVNTLKREILLVNYYCPNNANLALQNIHVSDSNFIIMGDFNSHSQSWGYDHIDNRGEEIEAWQDDNNLTFINQPYDTPTFYSRCWHTTSTPDIALCTEDLHSITMREVGDQLGGSDHNYDVLCLYATHILCLHYIYYFSNFIVYISFILC